MDDEAIRNGSRTDPGSDERVEVVTPAGRPVPSVPPMEAEWLRAVGGRPAVDGRRNGSASRSWNGNGRSGAGVDSTRGGH